jgi:hypothetical protein
MNMLFDNHVISITGLSAEDFKKALSFFDVKNLAGYRISNTDGMILYWTDKGSETKPIRKFPYTLASRVEVENFVWGWLQSPEAKELLGEEPNHDGSNDVGWRVFNEEWTHVDDDWSARVAICPIWAMYGK